jgi:hypothetical protein
MTMIKAILELPEQHTAVLTFLLKEIPPAKYPWTLTGSAGLRLHGLDISVNDLDLQTDASTIFLLEKKLSPFIKSTVHFWETEHTLSYHGQAEIQGLQVELLGDIRHRLADQTWSESLQIESVLVWVEWHDLEVPVLSLEHEALAYERMGRTQKAALIRSALRKEIP